MSTTFSVNFRSFDSLNRAYQIGLKGGMLYFDACLFVSAPISGQQWSGSSLIGMTPQKSR